MGARRLLRRQCAERFFDARLSGNSKRSEDLVQPKPRESGRDGSFAALFLDWLGQHRPAPRTLQSVCDLDAYRALRELHFDRALVAAWNQLHRPWSRDISRRVLPAPPWPVVGISGCRPVQSRISMPRRLALPRRPVRILRNRSVYAVRRRSGPRATTRITPTWGHTAWSSQLRQDVGVSERSLRRGWWHRRCAVCGGSFHSRDLVLDVVQNTDPSKDCCLCRWCAFPPEGDLNVPDRPGGQRNPK